MRPVNLIPPEERRGQSATKGSGLAAYLIVGILAVAVIAVGASTYFGNQVSEKEAEVAALESDVQSAQAAAASNASFVSLQSIRDARVLTIDSLAKSRFDWERVLRELSRIIPEDVALTNVTGTVSPDVSVEGGTTVPFREGVTGPALEIVGCAKGQRDLAAFIASMHDIDGVTRVTAPEGVRGEAPSEEDGAASSTASGGGCARAADSAFQLVAAFDAVPVPEGALPADPAAAVTTTTAAPATTESTATAATATTETPPADAETSASTAQAQQQIDNAKTKSDDATNIVPGG